MADYPVGKLDLLILGKLKLLRKQFDNFVQIKKPQDNQPVSISIGDLRMLLQLVEDSLIGEAKPKNSYETMPLPPPSHPEPSSLTTNYINSISD